MAAAHSHPKNSIGADGLKTCQQCRVRKPTSAFSPNPKRPGSFRSKCRPCTAQISARYHGENREKILAKMIAARLKKCYGLTVEQYHAMKTKQGGGCAICGSTTPGGKDNKLHVDHDHKTGKVRGLLCNRCNIALGGFGDDIQRLRLAIQYLERAR